MLNIRRVAEFSCSSTNLFYLCSYKNMKHKILEWSDIDRMIIIKYSNCGSVELLTSSLGLQEKCIAIVPEEHTSVRQLVDGLNLSLEAVKKTNKPSVTSALQILYIAGNTPL